ncbi:MAG TPA: sortase [Candidatus Saccharimonadales bacterium]|nr:sortase [Candidatus Saccharimonadales bacterium]
MDDTYKLTNDAQLPLPGPGGSAGNADSGQDQAVELIRKKINSLYASEPPAVDEKQDLAKITPEATPSKHQDFIRHLLSSGKPLETIQTEWHEYYLGLSDVDKHQVWQEFYNIHNQAARWRPSEPQMAPGAKPAVLPRPKPSTSKTVADVLEAAGIESLRHKLPKAIAGRRLSLKEHLQSLAYGLSVGCLVIVVLMFSFFNQKFIAPLIQPSRDVTNIPLIVSGTVGSKPELIVPKINLEVPVIYRVDTINEQAVQNALESGVVHYADTAMPGQDGNLVIVGHSSNNILNPGRFKFAFVLLHDLQVGDTFFIQKDGKRYTYQVYERKIVSPTDVSVLGPADKPATASLITCDPPGTSNNRLVVIGQQISPDPSSNIAANAHQNSLAVTSQTIPGNSPSLWSRITSGL